MGQKPVRNQDARLHAAFGRALKVLRAERGVERKELAERAGLSYAYVSDIESGKKRPSSRALLALADALELRPHELMARAEGFEERVSAARKEPDVPSLDPGSAAFYQRLPSRSDRFHLAMPPPGDRQALLTELADLAATLDTEDVRRLRDLARRLAR